MKKQQHLREESETAALRWSVVRFAQFDNSWMVGNPELATNGLEEMHRISSKPTSRRVVRHLVGLNFRLPVIRSVYNRFSQVTSPSRGFEV